MTAFSIPKLGHCKSCWSSPQKKRRPDNIPEVVSRAVPVQRVGPTTGYALGASPPLTTELRLHPHQRGLWAFMDKSGMLLLSQPEPETGATYHSAEEVDLDLQELQRIPVGIRESTLFIETSKTKTLKHVAFMSHYHQLQKCYWKKHLGKCHRTILRTDTPEKQMLSVL